jgi:NADPH:quinone reductase
MHGWFCDTPTGVDALQWREAPTPEPAGGEVRIAIRAASLNFPDLLTVQDKYQIKPPRPFVPGSEFSGVVEAAGEGVTHLRVGDRVVSMGAWGGFGTHACVRAAQALPLPDAISDVDGAAFYFTYGTCYHALMDRAALKAGETVLVLGAAGGIGTAAIQIAKAAGARVIAAASGVDKAEWCRSVGADAAFDYVGRDLRDAVKEATGGRGPDVIVDPVGGAWAEAAFRSIAWRGRYLVIGFAGGPIPSLPLNLALLKGASLVGVFWGDFVRREPKIFAADLAQLARWYGEGLVKPVIHRTLPMRELHAAYALMAERGVRGKVVLVPESA